VSFDYSGRTAQPLTDEQRVHLNQHARD
jgi:hypothetical protein